MPDDLIATKSKCKTLYATMRRLQNEDINLSQDHMLCKYLIDPAYELIGAVARGAAATNVDKHKQDLYFDNAMRFSRAILAQFDAVLDAAQEAQAIREETFILLNEQVIAIQTNLNHLISEADKLIMTSHFCR